VSSPASEQRPYAFATFLIIAGLAGWVAAFALTLEKFHLLQNPGASLGCDFSLVVQCGANLNSPQGAAFFDIPNPLLGLAGFVAPIAVGAALLARARFAPWFWWLFNAGVLGAMLFMLWLIGQSIFVLGTLCPWCMVAWLVTIPLFWAVTLRNLALGIIPLPSALRRISAAAYGWVPALTVGSYLAVAIPAQLRLDVLAYI
jgi:uncharacterized membrane protein